jgi:hypothetical protein
MLKKTGAQLRDSGIKRVLRGKDEWLGNFTAAAEKILKRNGCVTSADVVNIIGHPPGNQNAIGGAMRGFAVANKLTAISYDRALSPTRRAGIVCVWGKIE